MSAAERAPEPAHERARPPSALPHLSVVLPCHEEANNLAPVVSALSVAAANASIASLEVLLVCSRAARDGTLRLAHALAAEDGRLRVVEQGARPRGYGGALRLGLAAARAPFVLLLDADGQLDPAELGCLWPLRGERRAVVGVRTERRDALARVVASRMYRAIARRLVPAAGAASDPDCAFKLLPMAAVDLRTLAATSGAVNLELLAGLRDAGCELVEVPVTHRPRQSGTARFELSGAFAGWPRPAAALEMLRDVVALAWRRRARAKGPA